MAHWLSVRPLFLPSDIVLICRWNKIKNKMLQYSGPVLEGRQEIFYLTTHSTHFIYGYMAYGI